MLLGLMPYSYRDAASKNLKVTVAVPEVNQRSTPEANQRSTLEVNQTSATNIYHVAPPQVISQRSSPEVIHRPTTTTLLSWVQYKRRCLGIEIATDMDQNRGQERDLSTPKGHQIPQPQRSEAEKRAREDALEAKFSAMLTSPDREVARFATIQLAKSILEGISKGTTTCQNVTNEQAHRELFTDWRQK